MFFDPEIPEVPIPDALDLVVEVDGMMAIFAAQRLERLDGLRREALADAARHGRVLTDVVERGIRLEVAAALRITEHAAGEMIRLADAVVQRYPQVLASLERARMTERHAELLVTAIDAVEPELRPALVQQAIALAETQPVGAFRRQLRRLIDVARTITLAERHQEAVATRRTAVEPAEDGMAWLHLYIPAVEAFAIHARSTAMAKAIVAHSEERRTLDQVRADVICDLLIDGDTACVAAEARGIRATVTVTVPVLALTGAGESERAAAGLAPAVVEGIGPIPIERARELAGGADAWMRVLTHPETGAVLSVGRDRYRPPPVLRRLVRWRADRCMGPGCGMPASRCEIDHTIAWEHGGATSIDNLAPLCKGHHLVKHHGGWEVSHVPGSGGALEWTSPAGRRYVVEPERRVPVFRPTAEADAPF